MDDLKIKDVMPAKAGIQPLINKKSMNPGFIWDEKCARMPQMFKMQEKFWILEKCFLKGF